MRQTIAFFFLHSIAMFLAFDALSGSDLGFGERLVGPECHRGQVNRMACRLVSDACFGAFVSCFVNHHARVASDTYNSPQ